MHNEDNSSLGPLDRPERPSVPPRPMHPVAWDARQSEPVWSPARPNYHTCPSLCSRLEPTDLLLELIDPFLERAHSQFSDMLTRRRALPDLRVELFQLLELLPCVLQLVRVFNRHGITSTVRPTTPSSA